MRIVGYLLVLISCLSGFLNSCKSKDKKVTDVNLVDNIYFDYKISAEEGYDNLSILLNYRIDNETGTAIIPEELKNVLLDGEKLVSDSSKMSGSYFEIQKPIETFSGKHVITFLTNDDKEYKVDFNFLPILLLTEITENIPREDLVLNFSGLEIEDKVRVLLTDTSFFGDGINRIDTIRNNQLILTKKDFEKLANGPILLEFSKELEIPINETSEAGGMVRINYTLRRTFNLQNLPY